MNCCRSLAVTLLVVIVTGARAFDNKAIDALAEKTLKDFEAPGLAVAIVKDDKVLLAKGYGVCELGKNDPVTSDTLFAIASCSKAFTAASVALMVEDGKMKWDDPIRTHLPWFKMYDPYADREVTLRDALCHRTGLSRHDILWLATPGEREQLLRRVADLRPTTLFRSTWEYNNIMFVAAGAAVGQAAGCSWEDFVQKRLFDPTGMKVACFRVKDAEQREHARPHRRLDDRKIESFEWKPIDSVAPAGSICANVNELTGWLRVHLNAGKLGDKRILPPDAIKEMHTPQMVVRNEGYFSIFFPPDVTEHLSYGLGWFISDYRGHRTISHGGTLEGFRAQTVLVPKKDLGIVVLTNLGGCRLPEAMTKNLLDMMLELPKRDWNNTYRQSDRKYFDIAVEEEQKRQKERKLDTKPSLPLIHYPGTYKSSDYGDVTVKIENRSLVLEWQGTALNLAHYHFDTFSYPAPYRGWGDNRVTFHLDNSGKVRSVLFLDREFKRN